MFTFTEIQDVAAFIKYLLQGGGRKVLCEIGERPTTRVRSEDNGIPWTEERVRRFCHDGQEEIQEPLPGPSRGTTGELSANHRPSSRPASFAVVALRKIQEHLLKFRVKDRANYAKAVNSKGSQADIEFLERNQIERDFSKWFLAARQNVLTRVQQSRWEDLAQHLPDDPKEYDGNVMSIDKSMKYFVKVLENQGMDTQARMSFLRAVYSVMNNNQYRKKRNTLYLIGVPNSGKSLISNSLALSGIFPFHTGEYSKNSSDFQFEDMVLCRTAHFDEPQIEPGKIEKFKVILEGGRFDTSVKFEAKGHVSGVPIIVTTNDEMWRYAPGSASAFEARIYRYDFKNEIQSFVIPGAFHPKMWFRLIQHFDIRRQVEEDGQSSDEEFNPDSFAPGFRRLPARACSNPTYDIQEQGVDKASTSSSNSTSGRSRDLIQLSSTSHSSSSSDTDHTYEDLDSDCVSCGDRSEDSHNSWGTWHRRRHQRRWTFQNTGRKKRLPRSSSEESLTSQSSTTLGSGTWESVASARTNARKRSKVSFKQYIESS